MKKFTLFLFVFSLCSAFFTSNVYAEDVEINKKNFPDSEFRNYVKNNFDTNNDNILNDNEAANVTVLPVGFTYSITSDDYGKVSVTQSNSSFPGEISDFTGIKYFVNLETFSYQNNELDELDFSKNLELKALFCNNTKLSDLDLEKNTKLQYLDCSNNKIKNLDLEANKKLLYLDCSNNKIKDLDLYEVKDIKSRDVRLSGDVWVSVDVKISGDPNPLVYLKCDQNNINAISLIDLDKNLLWLKCDHNQIKGKFFASDSENLLWLECDNNQIKELDLSNKKLRYLKCDNNVMTELDAGLCRQLEKLICDNNKIKDFSLPRNNNKFVYLSCSSNDIENMDKVPNSLEYIDFSKNRIDDYYFLKKGISLKTINSSNNKIGEVDLSALTALEVFYCDNNALPDISFVNNPSIKTFSGLSQKVYGQKVSNSKSNKDYPYEFDFSTLISRKGEVSRINDISVTRSDNSSIKSERNSDNLGTLLLAEKPAYIKYKYTPNAPFKDNYLEVTLFFEDAPKNNDYGSGNDDNNGSNSGNNNNNDANNNDNSNNNNNDSNNNNDDNDEHLYYDYDGGSGGGCNSGFIPGIIALSLLGVLKKKK